MPIKTTPDDIVLIGHGSYAGGSQNFALPDGVDLFVLQPVGTALAVVTGAALVAGTSIDRLALVQPANPENPNLPRKIDDCVALGMPTIYPLKQTPKMSPDLVLHDLGPDKARLQQAIPKGSSHVVLVEQPAVRLSDLLNRPELKALISDRVKNGKRVRVFWAACTTADSDPAPSSSFVTHNARALYFAAKADTLHPGVADAVGNPHDPDDTNAAIQAAKPYDIDKLLKAL